MKLNKTIEILNGFVSKVRKRIGIGNTLIYLLVTRPKFEPVKKENNSFENRSIHNRSLGF